MGDSWGDTITRVTGGRQESPERMLVGGLLTLPSVFFLEHPSSIREELKKMNRDLTFLVDFSDNSGSGTQDPKKKRKLTIKYYPISDPLDAKDRDDSRDTSRGSGKSDRYARKDPVLWRTFEGKDDYALKTMAVNAWQRERVRGSGSEKPNPKDKVT